MSLVIKSHLRGPFYRKAAAYLLDKGENEKVRLVEISDIDAKNIHEAFENMWKVASLSRAKKPLHHVSINPSRDEKLTQEQFFKIIERCEQKYGYKPNEHQRVIVEHIKDGRRHYHIVWNRISLATGKGVWPGEHIKKSKQICREMEKELGLNPMVSKRMKRARAAGITTNRISKATNRYNGLKNPKPISFRPPYVKPIYTKQEQRPKETFLPAWLWMMKRRRKDENVPDSEKPLFGKTREQELLETLIWAWENKRPDVLASFGINLPEGYFEP